MKLFSTIRVYPEFRGAYSDVGIVHTDEGTVYTSIGRTQPMISCGNRLEPYADRIQVLYDSCMRHKKLLHDAVNTTSRKRRRKILRHLRRGTTNLITMVHPRYRKQARAHIAGILAVDKALAALVNESKERRS